MALSDWVSKSGKPATPATPATQRAVELEKATPKTTTVASVASVAAIPESPSSDFEDRRARVLSMLMATDGRNLAVLVEDPNTDPVSLAVAIRKLDGVYTFEVQIPKAKYDGLKLLELVEKHSKRSELALIDGGKVLEPEAA